MIKYLQQLDTRTFLSFYYSQYHSLSPKVAYLFSYTADGWFYFFLLPIFILFTPTEAEANIKLTLIAFATERLIYFTLKNSIKRRRPPAAIAGFQSLIKASDEFSLPSGHTSGAFLFATIVYLQVSPLLFPIYLWAAAVGLSRIILGVHFFTDVMLGALLGTSIALLVF